MIKQCVFALLCMLIAAAGHGATFSIKDKDVSSKPASASTSPLQEIDQRLEAIKKEAEAYKKQNEAAIQQGKSDSAATLAQRIQGMNEQRLNLLQMQRDQLQAQLKDALKLQQQTRAALQLCQLSSHESVLPDQTGQQARALVLKRSLASIQNDVKSAIASLRANSVSIKSLESEMNALQASQPSEKQLEAVLAQSTQQLRELQSGPMQKQQQLRMLLGLLEQKRQLMENKKNPQVAASPSGASGFPAMISITDEEIPDAADSAAPRLPPVAVQAVQNPAAPPGIEIETEGAHPVFVVVGGDVKYAGELRGFGQVAVLQHADGFFTVYAHLSRTLVREGDVVSPGDVVGISGALPSAKKGWGLRFEVRQNDVAVSPQSWPALPKNAAGMLVNGPRL